MASPDSFTPEEIEKRFQALPKDVQAAIYDANTNSALLAIGQKHQLHIDQLSTLEAQILFFIVGLIEPGEFSNKLESRLGVDIKKAQEIAQDVDVQITGKIRSVLQQTSQKTPPEKPAPAAPVASRTIMPAPPSSSADALRPATPARPSITSITRDTPPANQLTTNNERRTTNPLPPAPPKSATQTVQQPLQAASPTPMAPKAAPPPPNLPGVPFANQRTTAAPVQPADPLRRVNEKLSAPSLSAAKTFDLSLGGQTSKPPAPSPTAPEPPAKKPYTKDPYREPVE